MATLTYADEFLPRTECGRFPTLDFDDLSGFMKRLRRRIEPRQIRFYGAGEYGEQNFRPHFHVALFGIGKAEHSVIESAWGKGIVDTGYQGEAGIINKDSASYICGYVTKKRFNKNPGPILGQMFEAGARQEDARMSNRPGIGAHPKILESLVNALTSAQGADSILRLGDVPMALKHGGGRSWPLGRYLRRKLREEMGFPETGAQEGWFEQSVQRAQEEMLELCIGEGLVGLIKKEEETEDTKLFKSINREVGWRKELLQRRNVPLNEQLELKESRDKVRGRKL